ncbi:hypothetical protein D3C76_1220310 [compost metagenome]
MQYSTQKCFGDSNPHRLHDAGAGKHGLEILKAEHPRPPVDSSPHGVITVIEGVNQYVPDRVKRYEADT